MITGSKGMSGAAYLSARAAYLSGAGLVRIYTEESNRAILQELLPEAVMTTYSLDETESFEGTSGFAGMGGCALYWMRTRYGTAFGGITEKGA